MPMMLLPAVLGDIPANEAYSTTFSVTGAVPGAVVTFSLSAGAMPAGLSLDASTGVLSGTATIPGAYGFTISATDNSAPQNVASIAYSGNVLVETITIRLAGLVGALAGDINAIVTCNNAGRAALAAQIAANTAAINAIINDAATSGAHVTWSVDEIILQINTAISTALGGLTPAMVLILQQIEAEIAAGGTSLAAIIAGLAGAVRFDIAQALSIAQQAQARMNIGAVSAADVAALIATSANGWTDTDLAGLYGSLRTVACV